MWTPLTESKEFIDGQVRVLVAFTSDEKGDETFKRIYLLRSLDQLKSEVQAEIDRVTKALAAAAEVVIDVPLDTTIEPEPPPPAEIARRKYFTDLAVLKVMQDGIKTGIRKDSDPDYLAQQVLVKSEFLPEYEKV
jgi:hypothetical protein